MSDDDMYWPDKYPWSRRPTPQTPARVPVPHLSPNEGRQDIRRGRPLADLVAVADQAGDLREDVAVTGGGSPRLSLVMCPLRAYAQQSPWLLNCEVTTVYSRHSSGRLCAPGGVLGDGTVAFLCEVFVPVFKLTA
jgi:hypothetical protein